jgi:type I restriction-modification system DNA methylase subunit
MNTNIVKNYNCSSISELVNRYESNRDYYRNPKYNEAQLRSDFLDIFFELLGWDIKNISGKSISEREVILEEPIKNDVLEYSKKPDYTFRLFSERKFFLEAKKPSVSIEMNNETAKQVRRYGYTAKLKISVISNFEYLLIYDTSVHVEKDDNYQKALAKRYHYSEYEKYFNDIKQLLGKDSVYSGEFDNCWSDIELKIKHYSVDELFLKQINEWRIALGNEIYNYNNKITETALNDIVQSYLNRIIFLRICEDRNIEKYQTLFRLADSGNHNTLIEKFKTADKYYNSGLFDQKLKDKIVENISSVFWVIIKQLYYPESPYSFSVFSSDILGNIYEIFLSEKLVVRQNTVILEKKPENIDKDIVTTPQFIINDILKNTLVLKCSGKSDKEIFNMKFADICCGSGAFLLKLFQLLCEILIDYYSKNCPSKIIQTSINTYRLPFEIKRLLLEKCIFGFDKDYNAVEASKFGLLLKLLEDENTDTLLSLKPILPSLDNNIFWGNSLLNPDQVQNIDTSIIINPFDFSNVRFDIIVGNPPYMKSEDMKNITPLELPLYKNNYKSAYKQFDKYFLFIEKGLELLSDDGYLGFIVPSKFIKVGAGEELRRIISLNKHLLSFISFGSHQVFTDKTNYTCLLFLTKKSQNNFKYIEINDFEKYKIRISDKIDYDIKNCNEINSGVWVLLPSALSKIYNYILSKSIRLEEIVGEDNIFNGIQTSANNIYIFIPNSEDDDFYYFSKNNNNYKVEKDFTKPYFQTTHREDNLYTYRLLKPNARVIYPYFKTAKGIELYSLKQIKKKFPYSFKYLFEHKDILNNPKRDIKPEPKNPDEWYRYGRHQSLENCILPEKIIVGVLSLGDKYAIDTNSTLISSGGTAGYCAISMPETSDYSIYYVQALLNSKYLEWFSSIYGEVFRGGYIARGTKVLKEMPIYKIDFNNIREKKLHDDIVECQKELINIFTNIDKNLDNSRMKITFEKEFDRKKLYLETLLSKLYNLGDDDGFIPLIKELYAVN